jgi:Zn-dependent protease
MVGIGQGDVFGQIPALPSQINSSIEWLSAFLGTFMMINLLTFIFNLIPIPPLDGWKIIKQYVEKITHKKMNENIEYYLTIFVCVILLWIFVSGIAMDFVK